MDDGTISFSKNGKYLDKAFDIPQNLLGVTFYPAVVLKVRIIKLSFIINFHDDFIQNAEMRFNFGDTAFQYPQDGKGYSAVSKAANLVPFSGHAPTTSGSSGKRSQHLPMALIMEPARELAQQTHDNITLFKKYLPPPGVK